MNQIERHLHLNAIKTALNRGKIPHSTYCGSKTLSLFLQENRLAMSIVSKNWLYLHCHGCHGTCDGKISSGATGASPCQNKSGKFISSKGRRAEWGILPNGIVSNAHHTPWWRSAAPTQVWADFLLTTGFPEPFWQKKVIKAHTLCAVLKTIKDKFFCG